MSSHKMAFEALISQARAYHLQTPLSALMPFLPFSPASDPLLYLLIHGLTPPPDSVQQDNLLSDLTHLSGPGPDGSNVEYYQRPQFPPSLVVSSWTRISRNQGTQPWYPPNCPSGLLSLRAKQCRADPLPLITLPSWLAFPNVHGSSESK